MLRSPVLPGDSVQRFLLPLQALCGPFGLGGAFEVSRARGEEEHLRAGDSFQALQFFCFSPS